MRSFEVWGFRSSGRALVLFSEDGKPLEDFACAFTMRDAVWIARQEARSDDDTHFTPPPLVDVDAKEDFT